jgi:hypothetical protein
MDSTLQIQYIPIRLKNQEVPVWRQVPLGVVLCVCVCVVTVVCLTIETKQIESRRPYDTLTIRGPQ